MLGLIYATGHVVRENFAKAAAWFQKAADQGSPSAQCALGVMYARGAGLPRDSAQARRFFQIAADQGHPMARSALDSIKSGGNLERPL
jgi:TPR repeat protein